MRDNRPKVRLGRLVRSFLSPAALIHPLRMWHFHAYSHAVPRAQVQIGRDVRIAPTVSFRNGSKIRLGDHVQLAEGSLLWAGDTTSRIEVGDGCLIGPGAVLMAADYGTQPDRWLGDQPMIEADIIVGADCWIGARAVLTAGVTLGQGVVVGAGAVVTRDLPDNAIAGGVPARVLRLRS